MQYPTLRSARAAIDWLIASQPRREDVARIARDRSAPPLVVAAARVLYIAGSDARRYTFARDGTRQLAGLDPEVGRAFDRLADRLDGRPVQSVSVHRTTERSPAESLAALGALLERHPSLAHALAPRIAALAPGIAGGMTMPPDPHLPATRTPTEQPRTADPAPDCGDPPRDPPGSPQREAGGGGDTPSMFQPVCDSSGVIDHAEEGEVVVEGCVDDGSVEPGVVGVAPLVWWSSEGGVGCSKRETGRDRALRKRAEARAARAAARGALRVGGGTEF